MSTPATDWPHWSRFADEWIAWARTPNHDAFWAYRDTLLEFIGRFVGDLGATMAAGSVVVGHRLGLYSALAVGPATPEQLAAQKRAQLTAAKQDFTRLSLGLLLDSLPTYPLTFAFAAQAAAPQGTADVLDVTGEGGFNARLFIHHDTHLPIMVSWQAPPTSVILTTPGQPPPANVPPGAVLVPGPAAPAATASQEEKDAYTKTINDLRRAAQARPVEHRLYYADYRNVEGLVLPFRIRRAIGADTTEETTFDRFRLNTKIDPRKFVTK